MTPALEVNGLQKAYGSVQALRGVDLHVGRGELFGLLGPNGAGKSTLVKIACGLVRPSAGAASVCGAPAGSTEAQRELGYQPTVDLLEGLRHCVVHHRSRLKQSSPACRVA